jgi:hypothetical protein
MEETRRQIRRERGLPGLLYFALFLILLVFICLIVGGL